MQVLMQCDLFLSYIIENRQVVTNFNKKLQICSFMKIRKGGGESHAVPCGRTDGHGEARSRLSQLFENEKELSQTFTVPKKREQRRKLHHSRMAHLN